ncbi:MAG: 5-(carboxyamino)imidazole ribonucleotide synthase [Verrucomicrobiales bacterium]
MSFPGKTLGIVGGGQLGRMLALEARRLGYRTVSWTGASASPPVEGVCDLVLNKSFEDPAALAEFCQEADVATVEFENIPAATLRGIEEKIALYPSSDAIATCQHRSREKNFLRQHAIPCAPFALVNSLAELEAAYAEVGPTAVLKTAAFGYDGKGQVKITAADQLAAAWEEVEGQPSVLEGFVNFTCEVSVLVARDATGFMNTYPVGENTHRHHILDTTHVPARLDEKVAREARDIAKKIAEALDYRGLLAVEFFIKEDGEVIVNEMAPRPHNSGHYTQDAAVTSQFEQQLRAVCGLPLGSTELLGETVMLNLLGDMWRPQLDTARIFSTEGAKLHLYGKGEAAGRRKMGHVNLVGGSEVMARAQALKAALLGEAD